MSVFSNGLVGIGTINPGKQLEINSTTGDCMRLTYNDADGGAINYTDLLVSATGDLTITPSGGDTTITGNLATTLSTAAQPNITSLGTLTGLNISGLTLLGDLDGATGRARITSDSGVLYFQTGIADTSGSSSDFFIGNYQQTSDISTRKFMIKANGNVGIGIDSPDTNLHIKNSISSTTNPIFALQGTGTAGDGLSIDFKNTSSGTTSARINNYRYDTSDIGLVFSHWNSGLVETMVLRNGNVGIGTNDPSADLEVNQTTPEIRLTDNRSSISSGNDLGKISWYSRDVSFGSDYEPVAQIKIIANNSTVAPDGDMYFLTAIDGVLSTAMVIDILGDVIIGGTNTGSRLHIKQRVNSDVGGIKLENIAGDGIWSIYTSVSNNLLFTEGASTRGFLATGVNVSNIDFTGQHRSITNNSDINNNVINYVGLIVSSTGIYNNINNGNLYINEALPIVDITNTYQDKKVFGVISDREDDGDRTYTQGTFVSVIEKVNGDERLIINSVGEGMIWICDKNNVIENGDLIVSAGVGGYGCTQDSIFICNYTVGKITQDCDFSTPERYIDLSGNIITQATYELDTTNGYKCNFVGCVYYCG